MNKRDKLDEWTEKQLEQFEIISEYKNWTFADFSPFKAGADWAIGVMSESAMVKMQRERLDQLCLDKEKLQAKCERYEKALKVFAESDKCTLELLTYHSMSGRNIRREVHDGKQFAIEALNEGGKSE